MATKTDSQLLQDTLDVISDDMQEMRLQLQKISIIQEYQATDIARHIARTDILQKHVEQLEKYEQTCPARVNNQAHKTVMSWVKDASLIIGLVILLLKAFKVIP